MGTVVSLERNEKTGVGLDYHSYGQTVVTFQDTNLNALVSDVISGGRNSRGWEHVFSEYILRLFPSYKKVETSETSHILHAFVGNGSATITFSSPLFPDIFERRKPAGERFSYLPSLEFRCKMDIPTQFPPILVHGEFRYLSSPVIEDIANAVLRLKYAQYCAENPETPFGLMRHGGGALIVRPASEIFSVQEIMLGAANMIAEHDPATLVGLERLRQDESQHLTYRLALGELIMTQKSTVTK